MTIRVEVAATPPVGLALVVDAGVVDTNTVWPDPVWQDVTGDVTAFSCRRGRARDVARVSAGSATLVLNNHDGDWTPVGGQTGRWFDQTEVGRRFRVSYTVGDVHVPLFNGVVQSFEFTQQASSLYLSMQLEDDLGLLGRVTTAAVAAEGAGESAGARANRVLDAAGHQGVRNVDQTGSTLQAYTGAENAASYLQDVAQSDAGLLYAASDGTIVWRPRNTPRTLLVGVTDTKTAETSVRAGAGELPLVADSDSLVNRATVSADGLVDGVAQNLFSTAVHGRRDLTRTVLLDTQSDVTAAASWLLSGRDTPDLTFREASFLVESKSDVLAETLLSAEVGDTVDVEWTPPTESVPVSRLAQIEQVLVAARPGRTTLRWVLSDLTGRIPLQVGSSEFGVVGSQIVGW